MITTYLTGNNYERTVSVYTQMGVTAPLFYSNMFQSCRTIIREYSCTSSPCEINGVYISCYITDYFWNLKFYSLFCWPLLFLRNLDLFC